ncbi:polysaccharide biosynthesis tyrosine autokinase [bacterium]|nr:polysaccharide biosynthesis tyrosine autokinase [bacterium]
MEDIFNEQNLQSETLDIQKYIDALRHRWWVVLAITFALTIPWFIYVKKQPPVYKSEVWISFDNVSGDTSDDLIQSRMLRLKSRSFAEEVTAELGLTLELLDETSNRYISRFDFFSAFSTTHNPVPGVYKLIYYPTGYCTFYHDALRLDSLKFEQMVDTTVHYNGLKFSLKPTAFENQRTILFRINNFRGTVSSLRAREEVNFNRLGDVMSISLEDKDPMIASQTVNLLADIFIKQSKELSQDQMQERLDFLNERARVSRLELEKIEEQLKSFNFDHPLGLTDETKSAVDALKILELDSSRIDFQKKELQQFLNKFDSQNLNVNIDDLGHYIFRQIAALEAFADDSEMDMAKSQLNDYDRQKTSLQRERGLPDSNEDVIEISTKISDVEMMILTLAQSKLGDLNDELRNIRQQMREKQAILNRLPSEQVKMYNLDRQWRVKQQIYSKNFELLNEAELAAAVGSDNGRIIDEAVPVPYPVSASKKKKGAIGGGVALIIGLMSVLVSEALDKRIKTRTDIKRYLQLPILGVIPKVKFDDYELQDSEKAKSVSSQIVTHDYSPTPIGEAYRSLRTSILFNKSIGEIKTLAIGSVAPGEGKSFTAANLGITLAQQKSKTLLVDADLRRGVLHNSFNCPKKPGLTNYLTGVVPLDTILNETYIPNLTVITCGSLLPNPSELLGSDRMKRFIEGVRQRFDFVIFDTPPLMAASDAVILSTLVDGVLVLVRSGMTNRNHVAQKLELFNNLQTNVLGVLLNCAGVEVAHDGYSYYRY